MKYYLRLKFSTQSLQYAKCFALRERFLQLPTDQRLKEEALFLKLSPSFYLPSEMNNMHKVQLWDELQDICEDQWDETTLNSLVLFSKLHFSSGKKGQILALESQLEDDFFYAHEILMETLREAQVTFRTDQSQLKLESGDQIKLVAQLKLGAFRNETELESAVNFSNKEMHLPIALLAGSLDVMTTNHLGQSSTVRNLFTFIPNKDTLLKEQMHFIT